MFTGLVTAIGRITHVSDDEAGRILRVEAPYEGVTEGESIALNGVCLTVRAFGPGWFTVGAITTTLERTTIGTWGVGQRVNLERALAFGERLGGHLVQGHVDGVAECVAERMHGDAWLLDVRLPAGLWPLMVPHGSVTLDGVSLTVNALPSADVLQVSIIEYTRRHTTLGGLVPGSRLHVEADVIGKYIQRLAAPYAAAAAS
ncbi:MAG: riboflavin synthase [Gemmatimonadaceae bacterium]|nr:riboflavin synthase [Gemmatimonadaceae bacterium]